MFVVHRFLQYSGVIMLVNSPCAVVLYIHTHWTSLVQSHYFRTNCCITLCICFFVTFWSLSGNVSSVLCSNSLCCFPSGQLWTAACGGDPQRGDGAGQVSCLFLVFQHFAHILENVLKAHIFDVFPSLESLGEQEDNDWRDTVQLYKEEVRPIRMAWMFWFFFLFWQCPESL